MTAVFRVGPDGNGTVYYNKTEKEINKIVTQYEKAGWKVRFVGTPQCDENQRWYQIN